jgi:glucokinase
MAAGVVDRAGCVLMRQVVPTAAERGGQAVLDDALATVSALRTAAAAAGRQIAGLGISVCELVDLQGNVTSRYTVDWQGMPVQEAFRPGIARVVVEADVRAHAWAEAAIGAGRGLDSFVFVSVGSGISSCLVQNGRPFAGARGNALVLATMPLTVFDGEERRIEFTLEPFASGVGLAQRYRRHKAGATQVEEIVADAAQCSATAAAILRSGGEALGSALAWLVNVLDPAAVIVGGGLGLAGGLYWESALAAARSHIFADDSRDVPILQSACGPDAGLIGAALQVFGV